MATSNDRPTSVLDRPVATTATSDERLDAATLATAEPQVQARTTQATPGKPLPRGWGSHEERRMMMWGVAGFALLGLYAIVFVLIGQLLWSA